MNDNTPQFLLQNYKADISIEARRNQFVTHVKAIDPDYNDMLSLKYNIISGNDDHIFSINSESGMFSYCFFKRAKKMPKISSKCCETFTFHNPAFFYYFL